MIVRTLNLFAFVVVAAAAPVCAEQVRPRIVVLTDITNEPDDQESLVRFLVYANEYEIEGLIATTSTWLRDRTSVRNIRECVSAYGQVRGNLEIHASGFPTMPKLASVIKEGWPEFGMRGVGDNKDSAGSQHIIDVVDREDPRPVWVTAWGGTNCLAQALWKVRNTRTPEQVERFVSKIRVYTISDQDDAGPWMRREFPQLYYIVSPGGERSLEYYQATWTGISGDRHYFNGPEYRFDLVTNEWLLENVRTHGPLGEKYPKWEYIMEGDTPSFLNLINNGLGSHESPGYGGWGGRYMFKKTYADAGPIWQNSRDRVTTPDGRTHVSNTATIWRWRQAFQHDFAARMDWCVAGSRDDANHNPVAVVDGDQTKNVLHKDVNKGQQVRLSAAGSRDSDGDQLSYTWFHYAEAGRDLATAADLWTVELDDVATDKKERDAKAVNTDEVVVTVPSKLPRATKEVHIILDVEDDGEPSLHAYRRVILHVRDQVPSER